MNFTLRFLTLQTGNDLSLHDITAEVQRLVTETGIQQGLVTITSQHTTTALCINENEPRLLEDIYEFLRRLAPPKQNYLHNDIHLRDCPPDEPENAHSHLLAISLGASESVVVDEGRLVLGKWQSIMLCELDGPRQRRVCVQIMA